MIILAVVGALVAAISAADLWNRRESARVRNERIIDRIERQRLARRPRPCTHCERIRNAADKAMP